MRAVIGVVIFVWLVFAVAVSGLLTREWLQDYTSLSPTEQAMALTLLVVDERGHGGSGVAIDCHRVLTAGHVVWGDDPRSYKVKLGDREWDVLYARQLEGMDAAILTVHGGESPPVANTNLSITHGQRVLVTGHPWCGPVQVTHGVMSGESRWDDEWMTDADAAPGSSGCPVWNDNGELIAIVVAGTIGRGATFTVVLPISEILSGLEQPWRVGTEGTVGRGRVSRDGLY